MSFSERNKDSERELLFWVPFDRKEEKGKLVILYLFLEQYVFN